MARVDVDITEETRAVVASLLELLTGVTGSVGFVAWGPPPTYVIDQACLPVEPAGARARERLPDAVALPAGCESQPAPWWATPSPAPAVNGRPATTDLVLRVVPVGPGTGEPVAVVGLALDGEWAATRDLDRHLERAAHVLTAYLTRHPAPDSGRHRQTSGAEPGPAFPPPGQATDAAALQSIIDVLPEQVFTKDLDLRFTWANQRVASDLGFQSSADLIGRTDFDIFPHEAAAGFAAAERHMLASGEPLIEVFERQTRAGTIDSWRRTNKYPLRDEQGTIVGLVGSSWDVTDLLTSERSVRRLAALVESSNDAILAIDANQTIAEWTGASERMFQYTAAEVIGRHYSVVLPDGIPTLDWADLVAAVDVSFSDEIEVQGRRRDGVPVEIGVRAGVMRDVAGEPAGLSIIARDIGVRKRALSAVRRLEERYRSFLEQMPAITYITEPYTNDVVTTLLDLSNRVEEQFGYAAENWRDDPYFVFTLMRPEDRERVWAHERATERTGEPFYAEYQVVTATGAERWYRDEAILIRNDDGAPKYWLGLMLEISDLKRAEAESSAANDDLRAVNAELERVSGVKSEIISMISHEFRTPLTSIQGYSELLMDEALSPAEAASFAALINANALRLGRMINDTLDLDRLDSGRTELRLAAADLNRIVEAVVESVRPTTERHRFVLRLAPELPAITGDPDLLTQVLTNLVANAIKYSPAGGDITLTTRRDGERVLLAVEDQGLGIPPEYLERIFDRYTRIDRPEQHGIEGNGLGLPIARQIVELHAGRLWAESDSARPGSTFHLEFRLPPAGVVSRHEEAEHA